MGFPLLNTSLPLLRLISPSHHDRCCCLEDTGSQRTRESKTSYAQIDFAIPKYFVLAQYLIKATCFSTFSIIQLSIRNRNTQHLYFLQKTVRQQRYLSSVLFAKKIVCQQRYLTSVLFVNRHNRSNIRCYLSI